MKIWEVASGRVLGSRRSEHRSVRCVIFSPDGKTLAASSDDGTIDVFDELDDLEKARTFSAHDQAILALAWSPDGKLMASGCADGTIKVWNMADRRTVLNMRAGSAWVSSLAWSPDSTQLAAACGRLIKTRNATDGREIVTMRGHADAATGVAWSPDGHRLASTGSDHSVRIWDPKTAEETLAIPSHASTAFCGVAWSPDGLRLARAGLEVVWIWDAALGYERERSVRALPLLDRTIVSEAAPADAIRLRSAILAQQGDWDRPAADWDRVARLDPENRDPLLGTGWWIAEPHAASGRLQAKRTTGPDPGESVPDASALASSPTWRQAPVSADRAVEFDELLPQDEPLVGFLRVYCSIGQPVCATFQAPGDLLLWLNGRPVHESDETSSNQFTSRRLPLVLRQGWNTIWVGVARGEGQRRLSVALSNMPEESASALIERGRWDEAFRLLGESLERTPDDTTLLLTAARLKRRHSGDLRANGHADAAAADEREVRALYARPVEKQPYDSGAISEFRDYLRSSNPHPVWKVRTPTSLLSAGGATLTPLADGSILASGKNPENDTYTIVVQPEGRAITAIRLEVLPDSTLPDKGSGRNGAGNFHLTEITLAARYPDASARFEAVPLVRALASYTRPLDHDTTFRDGPRGAIDGKQSTRWDIWPQVSRVHVAFFAIEHPVGKHGPATLTIRLDFQDPVFQHVSLGRFRLSVTSDEYPLAIERLQSTDDPNGLAGARYAGGDVEGAMDLLKSTAAQTGGDVQSWFALAACHAEAGRVAEARGFFDRAQAWLAKHVSDDGTKELALLARARIERSSGSKPTE